MNLCSSFIAIYEIRRYLQVCHFDAIEAGDGGSYASSGDAGVEGWYIMRSPGSNYESQGDASEAFVQAYTALQQRVARGDKGEEE